MLVSGEGGIGRRSLWLVWGLASLAVVATVVSLIAGPRSAIEAAPAQVDDGHDHGHDHDHASMLTADGRFTGPGEVWPPQVRGATDVVALDFDEVEAATSRRAMDAPAAARAMEADAGTTIDVAMADARVATELGVRHTLISVTEDEIVPGSAKGDPEATLVLFYSHDLAVTVEAYVVGAQVVEIASHPAGDQQPPLAVDEKHRATEVARAHWEAAGDGRIDQLEGFVILAVEPDGSYYDSRVAYVSFHLDNEARPELLTWVDLTTETVLEAEVDR